MCGGDPGEGEGWAPHQLGVGKRRIFLNCWKARTNVSEMKCASVVVCPNRENVNGVLTPAAPPTAGFAFTFKIIYGAFKAARHPQPETHNCRASRSFTRRSPKCYVLMGGSGAKHREITNTGRTNRSRARREVGAVSFHNTPGTGGG